MLIVGGNQSAGGYDIDNSLRFNSGSSDYLNRTPSTSNRKTATLSFWIKKSKTIAENDELFNFGLYPSATRLYFRDGGDLNKLALDNYGGSTLGFSTNQLFRDYSAWYHIVVAIDTTQTTSTNRLKLYVNGEQITSFASINYGSLNDDMFFNNSSSVNYIGRNHQIKYFDGYMSEVNFIDGQQLDPISFGEFDSDSGVWKPIPYTGSYGTNGFFLEFQNSAALGTDSSGNGNTFTVNNLTSIDQTTDTPTNNFATLNALENTFSSFTLSEGNLKAVTANYSFIRSTIGVSSGKWYCEVKCTAQTGSTNKWQFGISDSTTTSSTDFIGFNSYQYGWRGEANTIFYNGTSASYGSGAMATGMIVGIALDLDNNKIYWSRDGVWKNSADPATNTNGFSITGASSTNTGFYHFAFGELDGDTNFTFECNFGNPPFTISSGNADANGYGNFEYAVPSGYYALCTKNLAEFG